MKVDDYEDFIKILLHTKCNDRSNIAIVNIEPVIEGQPNDGLVRGLTVKDVDSLLVNERYIKLGLDFTYFRCINRDVYDFEPDVLGEYETLKQAVRNFII